MEENNLNFFIQSLDKIQADIALIELNKYLGHTTEENKKIHRINIKTLVNKFPVSWCKKDENKYLAPTFKKSAYIEHLT